MKLQSMVLTASIDDEDGIRRWIESVGNATQEANEALERLSAALVAAPHISITLHQHKPEGTE